MITFPRHGGPHVTVLLPTRSRPALLRKSIESLWNKSVYHSMEFLLKVDTDDTPTLEEVEKLIAEYPVRALISDRETGYHQMHVWINQLCTLAKGDWLLIWNDDAEMLTDKWDHILLYTRVTECWHNCPEMILLSPVVNGRPMCHEFPMLRKKAFDFLGHWALNPHNDNWIFTVFEMSKSVFRVPIFIEHFSDRMDDTIRHECVEAYKTTSRILSEHDCLKQKLEDACRIFEYIEKHNTKTKESCA